MTEELSSTRVLAGRNSSADDPANRPTNKVTGGDLEDLWRVANRHLPTVENAYNKQINNMQDANPGADSKKYGPCHPAWSAMAEIYQNFLWHTSMSLSSVSILMNQAINEYKHVDGSNGKELTDIGKELEYIIKDTDPVEPTEITDDFKPGDIDASDDWELK